MQESWLQTEVSQITSLSFSYVGFVSLVVSPAISRGMRYHCSTWDQWMISHLSCPDKNEAAPSRFGGSGADAASSTDLIDSAFHARSILENDDIRGRAQERYAIDITAQCVKPQELTMALHATPARSIFPNFSIETGENRLSKGLKSSC